MISESNLPQFFETQQVCLPDMLTHVSTTETIWSHLKNSPKKGCYYPCHVGNPRNPFTFCLTPLLDDILFHEIIDQYKY
jgi:Zn-finger protein